ncbi:Aste57867_22029 [Aphanomyces stellatus]|uniref:Aste57867_22029 protein n=1 Tax=Aphanomyces stellatus TaxID=120398 RepID=A0A485LJ57_9STRA|nr:hypothetical protein As57867_021960 [Aphanomyces stellatus]VFT98697.1 Aste57867_22029 [Aphanomyces stellatus]
MLVLKRWLHVWYLASTVVADDERASDEKGGDEDVVGGGNRRVLVHVQGDKPEQDQIVAFNTLIPQAIVTPPPAAGCFGMPGAFVQIFLADAAWIPALRTNGATLVGRVAAALCAKDCSMVDVTLPGPESRTRRCQLGQAYMRVILEEDFNAMQDKLREIDVMHPIVDNMSPSKLIQLDKTRHNDHKDMS